MTGVFGAIVIFCLLACPPGVFNSITVGNEGMVGAVAASLYQLINNIYSQVVISITILNTQLAKYTATSSVLLSLAVKILRVIFLYALKVKQPCIKYKKSVKYITVKWVIITPVAPLQATLSPPFSPTGRKDVSPALHN